MTNIDSLKVGCAITFCCHLDLEIIENEEQLEQVKKLLHSKDGERYEYWPTAKEAYLEMAGRWPKDSKEYGECIDYYRHLANKVNYV